VDGGWVNRWYESGAALSGGRALLLGLLAELRGQANLRCSAVRAEEERAFIPGGKDSMAA
jgi:hypothetical protein